MTHALNDGLPRRGGIGHENPGRQSKSLLLPHRRQSNRQPRNESRRNK